MGIDALVDAPGITHTETAPTLSPLEIESPLKPSPAETLNIPIVVKTVSVGQFDATKAPEAKTFFADTEDFMQPAFITKSPEGYKQARKRVEQQFVPQHGGKLVPRPDHPYREKDPDQQVGRRKQKQLQNTIASGIEEYYEEKADARPRSMTFPDVPKPKSTPSQSDSPQFYKEPRSKIHLNTGARKKQREQEAREQGISVEELMLRRKKTAPEGSVIAPVVPTITTPVAPVPVKKELPQYPPGDTFTEPLAWKQRNRGQGLIESLQTPRIKPGDSLPKKHHGRLAKSEDFSGT